MKLVIKRLVYTPISTTGEMTIDGAHFCYTIERPREDKDGHPCIPAGVYETERHISPHLEYEVLRLLDVPGRSEILIHKANWASQLLGCIAVGRDLGKDFIGESKIAFDALMEKTKDQPVEVDIS
jgi:hypothetical protein